MYLQRVLNEYHEKNFDSLDTFIAEYAGMKKNTITRILEDNGHRYQALQALNYDDLVKYDVSDEQQEKLSNIFMMIHMLYKETSKERLRVTSPSSLAAHYMDMKYEEQEIMVVLYLNTKYEVIKEQLLTKGSITSTICDKRDVAKYALRLNATCVLLLHQHPSGDPEPSQEDISLTNKVEKSLETLGIRLLDHMIIGDGTYSSLKEMGYIH